MVRKAGNLLVRHGTGLLMTCIEDVCICRDKRMYCIRSALHERKDVIVARSPAKSFDRYDKSTKVLNPGLSGRTYREPHRPALQSYTHTYNILERHLQAPTRKIRGRWTWSSSGPSEDSG